MAVYTFTIPGEKTTVEGDSLDEAKEKVHIDPSPVTKRIRVGPGIQV